MRGKEKVFYSSMKIWVDKTNLLSTQQKFDERSTHPLCIRSKPSKTWMLPKSLHGCIHGVFAMMRSDDLSFLTLF
jgi:hypothetical protein